jgi:hypothetical protein
MKAVGIPLFLALALPSLVGASQNAHSAEPLVIVREGRYGYIDHTGAMLIRPQFLWAADFEDGLGTVYVCGHLLAIDISGNLLPLHSKQKPPKLRPITRGTKVVFVDATGQRLGNTSFDEALPFSEGLAAVRLGNKWGFIDTSGRIVIPPTFEAAFYFREGVANATLSADPVLIDKSGKVLARGYDQLSGVVAEGRIPVSRASKYGYLDLHGAIAIPLIYDGADSFSEGLAPVKRGEKWGYIDGDGAVVIPFVFDSADVFGSGLAPVRKEGQSGFIDTSGNFVFRLSFEESPGFWQLDGDTDVSRFWTQQGDFGYVNSSGNVIWGPTKDVPDHAPLVGWSDEDKVQSCIGVPDDVRKRIASFPTGDE